MMLILCLEALTEPIFNKEFVTQLMKKDGGDSIVVLWGSLSYEKQNLAERLLTFLRSLNQSESYVTLDHINSVFGKFFFDLSNVNENSIKMLFECTYTSLGFSPSSVRLSKKSSKETPPDLPTLAHKLFPSRIMASHRSASIDSYQSNVPMQRNSEISYAKQPLPDLPEVQGASHQTPHVSVDLLEIDTTSLAKNFKHKSKHSSFEDLEKAKKSDKKYFGPKEN